MSRRSASWTMHQNTLLVKRLTDVARKLSACRPADSSIASKKTREITSFLEAPLIVLPVPMLATFAAWKTNSNGGFGKATLLRLATADKRPAAARATIGGQLPTTMIGGKMTGGMIDGAPVTGAENQNFVGGQLPTKSHYLSTSRRQNQSDDKNKMQKANYIIIGKQCPTRHKDLIERRCVLFE